MFVCTFRVLFVFNVNKKKKLHIEVKDGTSDDKKFFVLFMFPRFITHTHTHTHTHICTIKYF